MGLRHNGHGIDVGELQLQEAAEQLVQEIRSAGAFVLYVRLNGTDVGLGQLEQAIPKHPEPDVEIISGGLDQWIEAVMTSSAAVIPSLHEALMTSAELLAAGDFQGGHSRLADALEILDWHANVLTELVAHQPGPSFIHEMTEQLQLCVAAAQTALEAEDMSRLADGIQYELIPWVERWFAGVQVFQQQMRVAAVQNQMAPR